jgi:imidazole glycerol-phosphate synthase subunit HisF
MLKKRIIPCLDIKDGRTVKGVNFIGLQDAGDPVALAKQYAEQGADELVFLDITATVENRKTLCQVVDRIAKEIDIPFTVGGGIQSLQDAREIISAGADKVSINSAAVRNPALIAEIAGSFGSQAVVVAIDARLQNNTWEVVINGGRVSTGILVKDWMLEVQKQSAGEILLTSMNHDGVKCGFALDLINQLQPYSKLPLIASGGAGTAVHFSDLFLQTPASAGLAASIFHFGEITIPSLKKYLANQNIPIR